MTYNLCLEQLDATTDCVLWFEYPMVYQEGHPLFLCGQEKLQKNPRVERDGD